MAGSLSLSWLPGALAALVGVSGCVDRVYNAGCPQGTYLTASGDQCSATPPDGGAGGDGGDGGTTPCTTGASCPGSAPVCGPAQSCVACASPGVSTDCAQYHKDTPLCGPKGACVECLTKDDCDPVLKACDQATGACAACRANADCTSGLCASGACVDKATLLYVNNATGAHCSDTGTGAFGTPFCSVQVGFAAAAATGKTLIVFSGTYAEAVVAQPGTGAYTVHAVGVGATPPVIAPPAAASAPALKLQTNNGQQITVTLENFALQNATGVTGYGVLCGGLGGSNGLTRLTLVGSTVQANAQLGVAATSCDVTLDRVVVAANGQGGVSLSSCDFTLSNALVRDNGKADPGGSTLGGIGTSGASTRAVIVNSTIVGNRNAASGFTPVGVACGGATVFFNDVVKGNSGVANELGGCAPVYSAYNGGTGSNKDLALCMSADLFLSPGSNDYHPRKTPSGACPVVLVDDGIDVSAGVRAPDHDLEGTPRPQPAGGAFDIGCYEAR